MLSKTVKYSEVTINSFARKKLSNCTSEVSATLSYKCQRK